VVLYRTTEPTPWAVHDERYELDADRGFGDLCERLEVIPVEGSHHLNLLDPPAVQVVAAHLGDRLRR
jgi:phthiocerol/phenolphthiocerol synthesis type-I polyketide synthase D